MIPKSYYLELFPASEGTLNRCSQLHLQSLAHTNPHWARVMGYGLFSSCVIYKEGLSPAVGTLLVDDDDGKTLVVLSGFRSDLEHF
jgi:hypothetical protein